MNKNNENRNHILSWRQNTQARTTQNLAPEVSLHHEEQQAPPLSAIRNYVRPTHMEVYGYRHTLLFLMTHEHHIAAEN